MVRRGETAVDAPRIVGGSVLSGGAEVTIGRTFSLTFNLER